MSEAEQGYDPADLTAKVQCGDCGRLVDISIECAPGTQWRCYDCGWGSK